MSLDFDEFLKGLWGDKKPKNQEWIKWVHRNLSENHCPECLALDGCRFAGENHPWHPHHPYCHCVLDNIPKSVVEEKAEAYAAYSIFDPYLFDPDNSYKHGQRISIRVEIPRKNKNEMVSFITGWMVRPNGLIHLNTPYGAE